MADVIELDAHRPHIAGEARCYVCDHAWAAVAPVGTVWLVCPKCGCERAAYRNRIEDEGAHWTCECGWHLFAVTPYRAYCPQCGKTQDFPVPGGRP